MNSRQQLAQEQLVDTKILQKVNHTLRDAFNEKYPGQVDHCLRLIMERLHCGLDKRGGADPADPDTWTLTAEELSAMSQAAFNLHQIKLSFDSEQ